MMTVEYETVQVARHGHADRYAGLNGAELLEALLADKSEADETIDLLMCHAVIGKLETETERSPVPA